MQPLQGMGVEVQTGPQRGKVDAEGVIADGDRITSKSVIFAGQPLPLRHHGLEITRRSNPSSGAASLDAVLSRAFRVGIEPSVRKSGHRMPG